MMHVLVVTHLFGCVEIEITVFFSFPGAEETEPEARCLALKPLVFPSKIRFRSNTIRS